jgi:hypothetical protein
MHFLIEFEKTQNHAFEKLSGGVQYGFTMGKKYF